jgi:hypothetical protein
MENEINQLLDQTQKAATKDAIDDVCKRIEALDKCETLLKIIYIGQWTNYSKLLYWKNKLKSSKAA